MLIIYFSANMAGLYTQSLSILLIPVLIFSRTLKTIITREYVDNKIDTTKMIIIIYNLLILLLVPFYAFLFFHSHKIFPILLGQNWSELSNIFNIMLFPMFILIFSSSLDRMYDVLNIKSGHYFLNYFLE